jgi:hypothetical protein
MLNLRAVKKARDRVRRPTLRECLEGILAAYLAGCAAVGAMVIAQTAGLSGWLLNAVGATTALIALILVVRGMRP